MYDCVEFDDYPGNIGLNIRQQLHQERAQMIMLLGNSLLKIEAADDVDRHQMISNKIIGDTMQHAACSRAFHKIWKIDRPFAKRIHSQCEQYFMETI